MRARHWLGLTAVLLTIGSAAMATLPSSSTGTAPLGTPSPGMPGPPQYLVLAGDATDGGAVDGGTYTDAGAVDAGWSGVATARISAGHCVQLSAKADATYQASVWPVANATAFSVDLFARQPQVKCLFSNQDTITVWSSSAQAVKISVVAGP